MIQFHPSARDRFTLEQIDRALADGASAVELDLRLRGDGVVVCSHSRNDLAGRPTLDQAVERILRYEGNSPTVRRDGLQFFLVLDFKERSPELYEGTVAALRRHHARWSTAAAPEGPPCGITVIASGERAGLEAVIPAATLDSLFVVEGMDYRGRIEDRSARPGRTFQWIAIQHPAERGRIGAIHRGMDLGARGVFNVRIYDCRGHLPECLASGADAVNADPDEVAPARERIEH